VNEEQTMNENEVNFNLPDEVVAYMKDAPDEDTWNERLLQVKAHYAGQYPAWWGARIVQAGIIPKGSMAQVRLDELQAEKPEDAAADAK
jgi:hypothetical protein